jgi:hypothetical protein
MLIFSRSVVDIPRGIGVSELGCDGASTINKHVPIMR